MTQLDIFDKVRAAVARELEVSPDEITPASTLAELGADSLDLLAALVRIEKETGREISNDRLATIETMGDLAREAANAV